MAGGCSHPLLGCAGARGGQVGRGGGVLPPPPPRDEAQAVSPGWGWHRVLDAGGGEGPLGAWGGRGRGGFLLLVRPFVIKAKSNLSLCLLLLGGARGGTAAPCPPVPQFPRAPQLRHRRVLLAVVFRGGRRRLLGGAALHPEPAPPGAAPAPGGRAGNGETEARGGPASPGAQRGRPRVPGGSSQPYLSVPPRWPAGGPSRLVPSPMSQPGRGGAWGWHWVGGGGCWGRGRRRWWPWRGAHGLGGRQQRHPSPLAGLGEMGGLGGGPH